MNPFFFGDSSQPLYGVHHPATAAARDEGVVLCQAFGQECMRSHRAMRQLALLLTKKGYHVLRFDYRGTGDSALEMQDVDANYWLADLDNAVEELREMSGVSKISVVGLRLGALIAGVGCARRDDINRLIIWDPILSGADYLRELKAEISAVDESSGNFEDKDGCVHFNGFALPAKFQAGLEKFNLHETDPKSVAEIYQAVSHDNPSFQALKKAWEKHPRFHYRMTPAPHDWNFVDVFGGILLPQPIIQAIVNWME